MPLKTTTALTIMLLLSCIAALATVQAGAGGSGTAPVSELESELTGIEQELTGLEKEIDVLLEDLVDPKITSLSVFFSSQNIRGQVPASVQIQLDGKLLTSREFAETDRLVLIRGGAIEVYSGLAEPVSHSLSIECFLSSGQPQGTITSTGKAVFEFEARRAVANFLEITLSQDPAKKVVTYKLGARHWSKEP
jgi:hypothetical protein